MVSNSNSTQSNSDSTPITVFHGKNSVKARIQKDVALIEVLRQLVNSKQLNVNLLNHSIRDFVLRSKEGVLITEDNVSMLLEGGKVFNLGSSPSREAEDLVESLRSDDLDTVKLATFSLKILLKEPQFLNEFVRLGGFFSLVEVIFIANANTLAYSLQALLVLLVLEVEVEIETIGSLDNSFYTRLVEIIATEPLTSIIRPATAILKHLIAPLSSNSFSNSSRNSRFAMVYEEIMKEEKFLQSVVARISSADLEAAELSFGLLNVLYKGSLQLKDTRLADELERLNIWSIVSKLLNTNQDDDISAILSFQANLISSLNLSLTTRTFKSYYHLFDKIWEISELDKDENNNYCWKLLGFKSESPQLEFETTGLLGVKALARFAIEHSIDFKAIVKEQLQRLPLERRCPIATVSSTVTLILAGHFDITLGISPSPTTIQPFLLQFYNLHHLVCLFFIRIWNQSGATVNDLERVTTLVKSQVGFVLHGESETKTWFQIKQEFENAEYRVVRDRQIEEAELNDNSFNKASIRSLRARIYAESYEIVRQQRINCLIDGAWFLLPNNSPVYSLSNKKSSPKWRFARLSRNTLYFLDSNERIKIRPGVDDLNLKLDLALVSEITTTDSNRTSRAQSVSTNHTATPIPNTNNSSLTFSLSANDGTIVQLTALDQHTFSAFVDGLKFLVSQGNNLSAETMGFIDTLTEVGVKVKLLDCSGEKFEYGSEVQVSKVPSNSNFYYSTM